jgi:flavodoxin
MKDTLFVYYSFEGNTEFVAQTAASAAEMDVERLIPEKEPPKKGFGKFFWGGQSVVMHKTPKLEPLKFNAADHKNIIFGFPVWAGSFPPAIASYLKDHKPEGKNCFIIACSAGGDAEKAFKKITEALEGNTIVDRLSLRDPAKDKETNAKTITDFIGKNFGN